MSHWTISDWFTFSHPSSTSRRSATNSMYRHMRVQFMPINDTGSASTRNSCSIATASRMISQIRSLDGRFTMYVNSRHAKSVCRPCTPIYTTSYQSFKLLLFSIFELANIFVSTSQISPKPEHTTTVFTVITHGFAAVTTSYAISLKQTSGNCSKTFYRLDTVIQTPKDICFTTHHHIHQSSHA